MTGWCRAYFKLSGPALFRWGGEYTWQATGPTSTGLGEPLPLPTTVVGALLAVLGARPPGPRPGLEGAARELASRLGCGQVLLRGPYYPAGARGVAIHVYPGMLLIIEEGGVRLAEPAPMEVEGTALSRSGKTTVGGMLYSARLVDPAGLEAEGVEPEVSVDVLCGRYCSPRRLGTVRLGGEGRVAAAAIEVDPNLPGLLSRVDEWGGRGLFAAASPILLDDPGTAVRLLGGGWIELGGCKLRAPTKSLVTRTLESLDGSREKALAMTKALRVRVEVLHPGVYRDGMPRRPLPAVLPGSLLEAKDCGRPELEQGLGLYRNLGFGTLVPLAEVRPG